MTIKQRIYEVLKDATTADAIRVLEKISTEIRQANSIRINNEQYGRKGKVDNDRPDLQSMK